MYSIKTKVCGNPDYGQDPLKPPYGIDIELLQADDLSQLKALVREWQYENDIGGGNWANPAVYKNNKVMGYMSYNGKVWDSPEWSIGSKEVA